MLKTNTLKLHRSLLKAFLLLCLIFILAISGLIAFLMVTEYRPQPLQSLPASPPHHHTTTPPSQIVTCLSWNIGYAGLSRELDFFYDGGKTVRPSFEESQRSLSGIENILSGYDTLDFLLLQEVDFRSKRSYFTDQAEWLSCKLPFHGMVTAPNYRCRFIPVPVTEPMGSVQSGLVTFSKWTSCEATRHAYQTTFPWPKRLVFLKRCFLVTRYPLGEGRELVMVNLHNSTFDQKGSLRIRELKQLREFLESEYREGHYVVAGGDWNINPSGYNPGSVITGDKAECVLPPMDPAYLPGWTFAYDTGTPTNRNVDQPYRKGRTGTTIIDYFLLSPNLSVRSVRTQDLGFVFSDHNPVLLTFEIN